MCWAPNLIKQALASPNHHTIRAIAAAVLDDAFRPPRHGEGFAGSCRAVCKHCGRVAFQRVVEELLDPTTVKHLLLRCLLPEALFELVSKRRLRAACLLGLLVQDLDAAIAHHSDQLRLAGILLL